MIALSTTIAPLCNAQLRSKVQKCRRARQQARAAQLATSSDSLPAKLGASSSHSWRARVVDGRALEADKVYHRIGVGVGVVVGGAVDGTVGLMALVGRDAHIVA